MRYGIAKVVESKAFPFEPTGLGKRFVVAAHDWGVAVRFWCFDSEAEARGLFHQLALRRIFVDTQAPSVVHDIQRPWTELAHAGEAPWVDYEVRAALESEL